MTMTPRSLKGVNSDERVPITIAASPFLAFSHAERRSLSFSPECSTSTGALKRWRKRAIVCGVRPISGTITSAWRPCASTFSRTLRYTSVLPEPVIPASSQAEKLSEAL